MGNLKKMLQPKGCQLAEIDPEDSYHSIDAKAKRPQEQEEQEDVQKIMGPSNLKKNLSMGADSIHHAKYAGRMVTVDDWMNSDSGNPLESDTPMNNAKINGHVEDEGEEFDNDDDDDDDSVDEEDEDEQDEVDDQAEEGTSTQSSTSTSGSGDERNPSNEDRNTESAPTKPNQKQEQQSDLMKQLKVSAKADIEKAKAVKNQLAMYERILALRIGIQKSLVATNKMVEMKLQIGTGEEQDTDVKEQAQNAIDELLAIGSQIGALRATFLEPIDGEPPRKRQKSNQDTTATRMNTWRDCLEESAQLDKRLSPYLQTTVRKWSSKINSTALISKKFDSTSRQQNTMDQLEKIWSSKDEKEKLILRSLTNRQQHKLLMNGNSDSPKRPPRPAIFEDRDFYLSLLRDVVKSAARNEDLAEESMISNKDYRAHRMHRENVDQKATKGRKIRYNVHEKLISVMVPIQNELWTDEKKDELFASLFGFGFENDDKPKEDIQHSSLSKLNGLKLF